MAHTADESSRRQKATRASLIVNGHRAMMFHKPGDDKSVAFSNPRLTVYAWVPGTLSMSILNFRCSHSG